MAVHQVVSGICRSLVKVFVTVSRGLDIAFHRADIHYLCLVRRQLEFADAGRNVTQSAYLVQLPSLAAVSDPCRMDLSSHGEYHSLAVIAPTGIADALS